MGNAWKMIERKRALKYELWSKPEIAEQREEGDSSQTLASNGGESGTRTPDPRIMIPLL